MIDLKQIQALTQILKENDLSLLELSSGEDKIKLERKPAAAVFAPPAPAVPAGKAVPAAPQPGFREVKSPMVGVFYAASSPDSGPFVKEGSRVKKGDVLCIIEAMKLMNEVNAEQDGKIMEVCVQNGDVVEYGQTLFKYV